MGGGSFDVDSYGSFSSSVADKPREVVYKSRGMDPSLDPKGVKFRESFDSADNPRSTPVVVALDVTGSMGMLAENIAKKGLGTLFTGILDRKPVTDPHVMFMGIGDAACDEAPLQVSQFEADNRIVDQLTKLWLEGRGGNNDHESYDLPWYFAGRHTVHDAMRKRGRKGYLFTVGDEMPPRVLTKAALSRFVGDDVQEDVPAKQSLEWASRLYHVFHVIIEEGSYFKNSVPGSVPRAWGELLGQRVISLSHHEHLAETIVAAIQVAEGADHATAAGGWSGSASRIVGNAVRGLQRGEPAPKRLGR